MVTSGGVAEWLGRGLQSPVLGFESQRRLQESLVTTTFGWVAFFVVWVVTRQRVHRSLQVG